MEKGGRRSIRGYDIRSLPSTYKKGDYEQGTNTVSLSILEIETFS